MKKGFEKTHREAFLLLICHFDTVEAIIFVLSRELVSKMHPSSCIPLSIIIYYLLLPPLFDQGLPITNFQEKVEAFYISENLKSA